MTEAVTNSRHRNNGRAWRRGMMHSRLASVRHTVKQIESKAVELQKAIDEAHDAGVLSLRGGVRTLPQKGSASDATGNSITNLEFQRLQSVGIYVANRIDRADSSIGAAVRALEDALVGIHEAWLDTDPDIGPDRRRERAEAREAAEQATKDKAAAQARDAELKEVLS